jgi:hypothetical protein
MPQMLVHAVTGERYPYNTDLARHADMQLVNEPDPQFAAAAAVDAPAPAVRKKAVKAPTDTSELDLSDIDLEDV